MTVGELIEKLKEFDRDAPIFYEADGGLASVEDIYTYSKDGELVICNLKDEDAARG